jgi:pimeloyl-ACP methyl ester carboxylesterase
MTKINPFILILFFLPTSLFSQKQLNPVLKAGKIILINQKSYATLNGFIDVPEDYSKPSSRRLQIPFYVVKSPSGSTSEPIFWLDGGPGGSNIVSEKKIISTNPTALLANHDFVCVGYRGVDGSTVLQSKKINKAMKGLNHQLLSQESLNNIKSKIKKYTTELKTNGIGISHYNILNVIEDIENVRKFLNYKKINFLSVSYGTRVALLYSYKYPKNLHRTVMIGACPPGYFLAKPYQAEKTIAFYDSLYKIQVKPDNKISIREAIKKSFDNLPKRWSIYKLDADKIKAGTASALYSRGFALFTFNAYFDAVNKGDFSGLFALQKIQDMNNKAVVGDAFAKTVSADMNSENVDENYLKGNQDSTLLGNNIFTIYQSMAKVWGIESIQKEFTTCRISEKETLIISGDLDFRTPAYIVEKELLPYLKNGKHIVLKNMSHIDILANTMKSQDFLQQYFDTGKVNESLLQKVESIDFQPKKGIGKAKIFVLGFIM